MSGTEHLWPSWQSSANSWAAVAELFAAGTKLAQLRFLTLPVLLLLLALLLWSIFGVVMAVAEMNANAGSNICCSFACPNLAAGPAGIAECCTECPTMVHEMDTRRYHRYMHKKTLSCPGYQFADITLRGNVDKIRLPLVIPWKIAIGFPGLNV
eukprot:scpid99261/ scgid9285/ 